MTQQQPPAIGQAWPEHGGIYAGLARGEDGKPDAHLVLLDELSPGKMRWADAVKWAEGLGNGARLPTRCESALLYSQLHDKVDDNYWYWTGTQYSDSIAWIQDFYDGYQLIYPKSAEGRARAVRRFPA